MAEKLTMIFCDQRHTCNADERESAIEDGYFSVASYNIHQAVGTDGRCDRGRIATVLKQLAADVIGLQEVDNKSEEQIFQLDYLARETGLKAIAGPTMRRRDSDYGNVLLTRHRILDVRNIDLSVPRREPRGAIDVDLEIHGATVRVIVTHLGLSRRERRRQANTLAELVAPKRDRLVVVLSDWNEWRPDRRTAQARASAFGKCERLRTFPAWLPLFALDRIWVWPEHALIETRVHRLAPAPRASDHLPVKAKINNVINT